MSQKKLEPTDNMKSSVMLHDRSQSVIMQDMGEPYELIEQLEKKNQVLAKSKESLFRKNNLQISKQMKKIEKLEKEAAKKDQSIIEKDKEIKLQQIKLRQFLQKNMMDLPIDTFDEIEDIIEPV